MTTIIGGVKLLSPDIKEPVMPISIKITMLQYLGVLVLSFAIAFSMHNIWVRHLNIYHTILEFTCVFIALSIFFSMWYTYKRNNITNCMLGFGYLMVAVFDSLHSLYFFGLELTADAYFDMSTRYWMMGRLTEAVVLFLSVQEFRFTFNKWTGLIAALSISTGIAYFTRAYNDYLPVLLDESGVTPVKSFLEYAAIVLFLASIYKLRGKLKKDNIVTYKYILISLLLNVPSEMCFAFYDSVTSIRWTLGHVLKIMSYYFLFNGIFVSTVTYPYERLEAEHGKLEEAYRELEQANKKLHNLHLLTQTVLNSVNSGIFMIGTNRIVMMCNRALEEVFEMERKDIVGMNADNLNRLLDFDVRELPDLVLKGKEQRRLYEATITTPKGNKKELLIYFSAIKNIDGETIGSIRVITDITEFKKEQQKLQQQEKLALIGQMASGIIHEIKNPLATIKGLSQMILRKAEAEKVKEYSRVIDSAIDDVSRVVNDFLNFAKPKPSIKREVFINEIIEDMKLMLETRCYTKNIKVVLELAAREFPIIADANKLKQVILNMCENAIDAMQETENPVLGIYSQYEEVRNEMAIAISDNGKGMSPEEKAKLGTPFFTTKEKGTGLGIGICNQIVNEHGGRIDVETEPGKGTVFTIAFPCLK